MGNTYGRQVLSPVQGMPIQVSASDKPEFKAIGLTVDWSTVAAVSGSDVTLNDGTVIKIGNKYLRYGQVLTRITATGKFGPYDPAAADGRQTLARGNVFIVNMTALESGLIPGLASGPSDHVPALEGGLVWKDRILATTGAASLAAGPTFATLEPVLPRLQYVQQ
jgi:hypothetical protein